MARALAPGVVETTPIIIKSGENEYELPRQMCIVIHQLRALMRKGDIFEINLDEDGNLEVSRRSLNLYTAKLF